MPARASDAQAGLLFRQERTCKLFFLAVRCRMLFGGFIAMMHRLRGMASRGVAVVATLFVVAAFHMFGGLPMVFGGFIVMLGG